MRLKNTVAMINTVATGIEKAIDTYYVKYDAKVVFPAQPIKKLWERMCSEIVALGRYASLDALCTQMQKGMCLAWDYLAQAVAEQTVNHGGKLAANRLMERA